LEKRGKAEQQDRGLIAAVAGEPGRGAETVEVDVLAVSSIDEPGERLDAQEEGFAQAPVELRVALLESLHALGEGPERPGRPEAGALTAGDAEAVDTAVLEDEVEELAVVGLHGEHELELTTRVIERVGDEALIRCPQVGDGCPGDVVDIGDAFARGFAE